MSDSKIQKAIKAYISIRNEVSARKKALDEELAELKEKQEKLGAFLLAEAERQGVESFSTSEGTAFKKIKDTVSVADWESVLKFVLYDVVRNMGVCSSGAATWELVGNALKADSLALFTQAVNKTAVKQFMMEHDQTPPDGVVYDMREEIQVRAPSKKKAGSKK